MFDGCEGTVALHLKLLGVEFWTLFMDEIFSHSMESIGAPRVLGCSRSRIREISELT
jgi:hypothetical protein